MFHFRCEFFLLFSDHNLQKLGRLTIADFGVTRFCQNHNHWLHMGSYYAQTFYNTRRNAVSTNVINKYMHSIRTNYTHFIFSLYMPFSMIIVDYMGKRSSSWLLGVVKSSSSSELFNWSSPTPRYVWFDFCLPQRHTRSQPSWSMNMYQYISYRMPETKWGIRTFLTNPHTFILQHIVRITESTGLSNQFV